MLRGIFRNQAARQSQPLNGAAMHFVVMHVGNTDVVVTGWFFVIVIVSMILWAIICGD